VCLTKKEPMQLCLSVLFHVVVNIITIIFFFVRVSILCQLFTAYLVSSYSACDPLPSRSRARPQQQKYFIVRMRASSNLLWKVECMRVCVVRRGRRVLVLPVCSKGTLDPHILFDELKYILL